MEVPSSTRISHAKCTRVLLHETIVISEEGQEETINRLLKPAAPPDSSNGVVVPHEAPDGSPKPRGASKLPVTCCPSPRRRARRWLGYYASLVPVVVVTQGNQTPRLSWPLLHSDKMRGNRASSCRDILQTLERRLGEPDLHLRARRSRHSWRPFLPIKKTPRNAKPMCLAREMSALAVQQAPSAADGTCSAPPESPVCTLRALLTSAELDEIQAAALEMREQKCWPPRQWEKLYMCASASALADGTHNG